MKKLIRRKVEKLKTGWYIWLFPLFALAITGWLMYDYYTEQGPRVKILFDDAAGVQAERTTVRFRGVTIGVVKDVYISEDQKDVVAEVLLRKDAEQFAVAGSKYSLITPQVNFQGISGLNTLIEGVYIAVLPGPRSGPKKNLFKAANTVSTDPLDETSVYFLETNNAESVSAGDSITYRGVKIGAVTKIFFDRLAQSVQVQINVENKYTRLIRDNTVFWRKAGIHAKLGLFNSEVKVNSLDSIMNSGVELATPEPAGGRAKWGQKFTLLPDPPKDYGKWRPALPARGAKVKVIATP
jgi:paraquat-inducible protein B